MSRPKLKKKSRYGTFKLEDGTIVDDLGPCPFCGGRVGAVNDGDKQASAHSMPICQKFETEDPLMFLHNMRVKLIGRLPDDDEYPMPIKQEPS
jgi:hypothetical protein